jgi:heme-degrading monooxygenase HmoA
MVSPGGTGRTTLIERNHIYLYIWEYRVRPDRVAEFERHYAPNGAWVQLFRRANGYRRTELCRDLNDPLRYVTIDYWDSLAAWQAFRSEFAGEFEELDRRCGAFTSLEREIGRFVAGAERDTDLPATKMGPSDDL